MKIFQLSQATGWRPKVAHGKTVGFVVKTDQTPERGGRNTRQSIFCRPIRGLDIFWTIQPTVLPWAAFCRASGALIAAILFFAHGTMAQTTNDLSDAEVQGHQLAQQLLEQRPAESFTNTGVLQIRDAKGDRTNVLVKFATIATETNWLNIYDIPGTNDATWRLAIAHNGTNFTQYEMSAWDKKSHSSMKLAVPLGDWQMFPYAGSDFCLGDLGLEFFHWPQQKVLKHELRRSRACKVLESTNPNPSTNGYSRVVSWIDTESLGIVEAYAYDASGKKLKEFYPKNLKKVNGQYQVETMFMENVQTGSRTRLEFDLKPE